MTKTSTIYSSADESSWAVDFATNITQRTAHGIHTKRPSTESSLSDPLIQKLFRIFLVFTDELDATDMTQSTYEKCVERKHKLSVAEVRALCSLLTREIGIFDVEPSSKTICQMAGTADSKCSMPWSEGQCSCCDMRERIADLPEAYNFREFVWLLGRLFPSRRIIEAAVESVFQRICNQVIRHGVVYVYRKPKMCRKSCQLAWCTVVPGKIMFWPLPKNAQDIAQVMATGKKKVFALDAKMSTVEARDMNDVKCAGSEPNQQFMWTVQLANKMNLVFSSVNPLDRFRWCAATKLGIERAEATENVYRPVLDRLRSMHKTVTNKISRTKNRPHSVAVTSVAHLVQCGGSKEPSPSNISDIIKLQPLQQNAEPTKHDAQSNAVQANDASPPPQGRRYSSVCRENDNLKELLAAETAKAKDEEIVRAVATRMLDDERERREKVEELLTDVEIERSERQARQQELEILRTQLSQLTEQAEQHQQTSKEQRKNSRLNLLEDLKKDQESLLIYQRDLKSSVTAEHAAFAEDLNKTRDTLTALMAKCAERVSMEIHDRQLRERAASHVEHACDTLVESPTSEESSRWAEERAIEKEQHQQLLLQQQRLINELQAKQARREEQQSEHEAVVEKLMQKTSTSETSSPEKSLPLQVAKKSKKNKKKTKSIAEDPPTPLIEHALRPTEDVCLLTEVHAEVTESHSLVEHIEADDHTETTMEPIQETLAIVETSCETSMETSQIRAPTEEMHVVTDQAPEITGSSPENLFASSPIATLVEIDPEAGTATLIERVQTPPRLPTGRPTDIDVDEVAEGDVVEFVREHRPSPTPGDPNMSREMSEVLIGERGRTASAMVDDDWLDYLGDSEPRALSEDNILDVLEERSIVEDVEVRLKELAKDSEKTETSTVGQDASDDIDWLDFVTAKKTTSPEKEQVVEEQIVVEVKETINEPSVEVEPTKPSKKSKSKSKSKKKSKNAAPVETEFVAAPAAEEPVVEESSVPAVEDTQEVVVEEIAKDSPTIFDETAQPSDISESADVTPLPPFGKESRSNSNNYDTWLDFLPTKTDEEGNKIVDGLAVPPQLMRAISEKSEADARTRTESEQMTGVVDEVIEEIVVQGEEQHFPKDQVDDDWLDYLSPTVGATESTEVKVEDVEVQVVETLPQVQDDMDWLDFVTTKKTPSPEPDAEPPVEVEQHQEIAEPTATAHIYPPTTLTTSRDEHSTLWSEATVITQNDFPDDVPQQMDEDPFFSTGGDFTDSVDIVQVDDGKHVGFAEESSSQPPETPSSSYGDPAFSLPVCSADVDLVKSMTSSLTSRELQVELGKGTTEETAEVGDTGSRPQSIDVPSSKESSPTKMPRKSKSKSKNKQKQEAVGEVTMIQEDTLITEAGPVVEAPVKPSKKSKKKPKKTAITAPVEEPTEPELDVATVQQEDSTVEQQTQETFEELLAEHGVDNVVPIESVEAQPSAEVVQEVLKTASSKETSPTKPLRNSKSKSKSRSTDIVLSQENVVVNQITEMEQHGIMVSQDDIVTQENTSSPSKESPAGKSPRKSKSKSKSKTTDSTPTTESVVFRQQSEMDRERLCSLHPQTDELVEEPRCISLISESNTMSPPPIDLEPVVVSADELVRPISAEVESVSVEEEPITEEVQPIITETTPVSCEADMVKTSTEAISTSVAVDIVSSVTVDTHIKANKKKAVSWETHHEEESSQHLSVDTSQLSSGYQSSQPSASPNRRVCRMPVGVDDTGYRTLMHDGHYVSTYEFEIPPFSQL